MDASSQMQRTCIITEKQSNQQVVSVTYLYLSYEICGEQWLSGKKIDLISKGLSLPQVLCCCLKQMLYPLSIACSMQGTPEHGWKVLTGVKHQRKQNLMA